MKTLSLRFLLKIITLIKLIDAIQIDFVICVHSFFSVLVSCTQVNMMFVMLL